MPTPQQIKNDVERLNEYIATNITVINDTTYGEVVGAILRKEIEIESFEIPEVESQADFNSVANILKNYTEQGLNLPTDPNPLSFSDGYSNYKASVLPDVDFERIDFREDAKKINDFLQKKGLSGNEVNSVEAFKAIFNGLNDGDLFLESVASPRTAEKSEFLKILKGVSSLGEFGMNVKILVSDKDADDIYMDYLKENHTVEFEEETLKREYAEFDKGANENQKKINAVLLEHELKTGEDENRRLTLSVLNALAKGNLKLDGIDKLENMNRVKFENLLESLSVFDNGTKCKFVQLEGDEKDHVYDEFMALNFQKDLETEGIRDNLIAKNLNNLSAERLVEAPMSQNNAVGVYDLEAANMVAGEMAGKTQREKVAIFFDYVYRLNKGEKVFPNQPEWDAKDVTPAERFNILAEYAEGIVTFAGRVNKFEHHTMAFGIGNTPKNPVGDGFDSVNVTNLIAYKDYFFFKTQHDGKSLADLVNGCAIENDSAFDAFKQAALNVNAKMLDGTTYHYLKGPSGKKTVLDETEKLALNKDLSDKAIAFLANKLPAVPDKLNEIPIADRNAITLALDAVNFFTPDIQREKIPRRAAAAIGQFLAKNPGLGEKYAFMEQGTIDAQEHDGRIASSFAKMNREQIVETARDYIERVMDGEKVFFDLDVNEKMSDREKYERASDFVTDLIVKNTDQNALDIKAEIEANKDQVLILRANGESFSDMVEENNHWYTRDSKEYKEFRAAALDIENKMKDGTFKQSESIVRGKLEYSQDAITAKHVLATKAISYLKHKFSERPSEADLNATERGRVKFAFKALASVMPDFKLSDLQDDVKNMIVNFLATQKGLIDTAKLPKEFQNAAAEKISQFTMLKGEMDANFGTNSLASTISKNHRYFDGDKTYLAFENNAKAVEKILAGKVAFDDKTVKEFSKSAFAYIKEKCEGKTVVDLPKGDVARVEFALNCLKLFDPDVSLDNISDYYYEEEAPEVQEEVKSNDDDLLKNADLDDMDISEILRRDTVNDINVQNDKENEKDDLQNEKKFNGIFN